MQSQMRLQITFFIEGFPAVFKWANVIARSIVLFQMNFEALLATVRLIAALNGTDKVFLLLVRLSVVSQVTFGHERFCATRMRAGKRTIILKLRITYWFINTIIRHLVKYNKGVLIHNTYMDFLVFE